MSTESRPIPGNLPVQPKKTWFRPSDEHLRELSAEMPNAQETEFGNLNVATRVVARSKASTFIVTDEPSRHSDQTITREKYAAMARLQDDYVREQEMLVIDGYIGNDPAFRTPARLIIERANANIAAMQRHLYFPLEAEADDFEPEVTVVYTPNLPAEGFPSERLIAVDLEANLTRVFNSDYFGESKKGGLRMWNNMVYERGGLSLHAGCKVIPVAGKKRVCLIVGLSGTGKTTTTFTRQNDSLAVQDDFIALMPDGKVHGTENGCFAKTFGLDPEYEPVIYQAVTSKNAYLENVSQREGKKVDFHDDSYTQNGRAVVRMADVENSCDTRELGKADFLLILNRNETVIPAVAKLNREQAAAYFMLGETKGTSAGGAEEAGKSLRVPGTNPFFPRLHAEQGNRFLELMDTCGLEVYLMNTGRVGGNESEPTSKKVKIPHSSACVKGVAEGTIEWETDPDFGYQVAKSVPGFDDPELLQPRRLYARTGREEAYRAQVERLKSERKEYMAKWPGLDQTLIDAVQ